MYSPALSLNFPKTAKIKSMSTHRPTAKRGKRPITVNEEEVNPIIVNTRIPIPVLIFPT
jgi:hypothetical protein|tara:strand:- start:310 stop:486 length:177 start_codon:yes stop_codon:yes gene_type:complete